MGQSVIKACHEKLLTGIRFLIAVMAAILVVVVFSNVIGRYFFHFALAWAEETARFLFIWLSFLGAVLANAHYAHMNLDIFVKWAPRKIGQLMMILANVIFLIILALLVDGGITMTIQNYNWETPVLEISYGLVYSIAPISCVIMMLQTLARIYQHGKELLRHTKGKSGEAGEV